MMEEALRAMGFLPADGVEWYRIDGPVMFFVYPWVDGWYATAVDAPMNHTRMDADDIVYHWAGTTNLEQTLCGGALEIQCFIMSVRDKYCSPTHGGNPHECDHESI